MGSRADASDPGSLVFTARRRWRRCWAPRHPRLQHSCSGWMGSVHRPERGSLATAIPEPPLPDGSAPARAGWDATKAPCRPGAGRERGQRIPAQLALSSVGRPGRGCWRSCWARGGTWCWAAKTVTGFTSHGFRCWQAVAAARLQMLAPDPNLALRPKPGWDAGDCAGGLAFHQELERRDAGRGTADCARAARATAANAVCDRACCC